MPKDLIQKKGRQKAPLEISVGAVLIERWVQVVFQKRVFTTP